MMKLHLLSGGAAYGLVAQIKSEFVETNGFDIGGSFGAVGLMKERLLSGDPCDVLILTKAMINDLANQGRAVPESVRDLGTVRTGIAIKADAEKPSVNTAEELASALESAIEIYFPDPDKATAGIHFMSVLKKLGLDKTLADRFRPYPNGATAMRALADASAVGQIGCTQITEILYTDGVQLVAPLPAEFELATVYTAAVSSTAKNPQAADDFIRMLSSPENEKLRMAGGFE
jgi:molybdate transport system substrate-binding protein